MWSNRPCLEAPGFRFPNGYVQSGRRVLGTRYAHRVAFFDYHGWLPPVVMHDCDNPPCIEETHLIPGTVAENNADMARKGRARGKAMVGTSNPSCKASDDDVQQIRTMYACGGVTIAEVGRRFGLSYTQTQRIIRHRSRTAA